MKIPTETPFPWSVTISSGRKSFLRVKLRLTFGHVAVVVNWANRQGQTHTP